MFVKVENHLQKSVHCGNLLEGNGIRYLMFLDTCERLGHNMRYGLKLPSVLT